MLEVLVGFDPADPYTATAVIAGAVKYSERLDKAALSGARIGVVRQVFGDASDPQAAEVNAVIEAALAAMVTAGATPVDIAIPDLQHYIELSSMYVTHSRHDIDGFLAARPQLPLKTLKDIVDAKNTIPNATSLMPWSKAPKTPTPTLSTIQTWMPAVSVPAGFTPAVCPWVWR